MIYNKNLAYFHLPGLFEFYEFYKVFLPLYKEHNEYFYDYIKIASIYGAPEDCIWGGGRLGVGYNNAKEILNLCKIYDISARLTFSNSQLRKEHLADKKCNKLCELFEKYNGINNGVIVHSELLLEYIKKYYPDLYLISSTTKVITDFDELRNELGREEFRYVVPDFRFNNRLELLEKLTPKEKDKLEFLCNECCYIGCINRKKCYENVSKRILDESVPEHVCIAPEGDNGYKFSKAMKSPAFIGIEDIKNTYLPNGFNNFKIEGRELGSALLLEFLLHYLVVPEYQLEVREHIYLDNMLNLF